MPQWGSPIFGDRIRGQGRLAGTKEAALAPHRIKNGDKVNGEGVIDGDVHSGSFNLCL